MQVSLKLPGAKKLNYRLNKINCFFNHCDLVYTSYAVSDVVILLFVGTRIDSSLEHEVSKKYSQ